MQNQKSHVFRSRGLGWTGFPRFLFSMLLSKKVFLRLSPTDLNSFTCFSFRTFPFFCSSRSSQLHKSREAETVACTLGFTGRGTLMPKPMLHVPATGTVLVLNVVQKRKGAHPVNNIALFQWLLHLFKEYCCPPLLFPPKPLILERKLHGASVRNTAYVAV